MNTEISFNIKLTENHLQTVELSTEKSIDASFNNVMQRSVSEMHAFARVAPEASEHNMRETLEDEMYKEEPINI